MRRFWYVAYNVLFQFLFLLFRVARIHIDRRLAGDRKRRLAAGTSTEWEESTNLLSHPLYIMCSSVVLVVFSAAFATTLATFLEIRKSGYVSSSFLPHNHLPWWANLLLLFCRLCPPLFQTDPFGPRYMRSQ